MMNSQKPKFCVNCKHYIEVDEANNICVYCCTLLMKENGWDLVKGLPLHTHMIRCQAMRADQKKCGREGKYFHSIWDNSLPKEESQR